MKAGVAPPPRAASIQNLRALEAIPELFLHRLMFPLAAMQNPHAAWEGFDVEEMRQHLNMLPSHNKKG